jgi:hypothetical protein
VSNQVLFTAQEALAAPDPGQALLHNRAFLMAVLDAVLSLVVFFVGKYAPNAIEDVNFVILTMQPIFVTLVVAFTYSDVQIARQKADLIIANTNLQEARAQASSRM